jgi:hypothetical protein
MEGVAFPIAKSLGEQRFVGGRREPEARPGDPKSALLVTEFRYRCEGAGTGYKGLAAT